MDPTAGDESKTSKAMTQEVSDNKAATEAGQQTETSTTEKTYSQSDFDRAVSKAISKATSGYEEKLQAIAQEKERAETEKLKADGKFEELLKKMEEQNKALQRKQEITELSNKLISENKGYLAPLVGNLYGSQEDLLERIQQVDKYIQDTVSKLVADKIKSPPVAQSDTTTTGKAPDQMTPDEYAKWRETQGIN